MTGSSRSAGPAVTGSACPIHRRTVRFGRWTPDNPYRLSVRCFAATWLAAAALITAAGPAVGEPPGPVPTPSVPSATGTPKASAPSPAGPHGSPAVVPPTRTKEDGAVRVLTPAQKSRMVSDFRSRGPEQRQALAKEMAGIRDLELTRLLAQTGLRDRSPQVLEAVQFALMASRGDPPHDSLVIELWRTEMRTVKRPAGDYLGRLATAVGNRRTTAAWEELARAALEGETTRRGECLDALLAAFDRIGVERDSAALTAMEQWVSSPWFDQSQGIRRSLVEVAIRFDDPRAVSLLVACLQRTDGEMRFAVAERLSELTGQKFGSDPVAWRGWLRERNAKRVDGLAVPAAVPSALPAAGNEAGRAATARELAGAPLYYYDLPVRAERVVFVLDVSKSMGLGGTTSRLAAAQRELVRTIGSLADGTLFNVVVFHDSVSPWQERLYPATAATRAHATAFVRGQRPQGKTATYDALDAAIRMSPTPEAIYVLSDGIPSTGEIVAPDRVLEAVRRNNQRLRVAIHALGTLAGPRDTGLADFLERLAAQNYGQFRRLE